MSEILWILFSSCLMCLLTSKTKREEKFYRKKEIQNIVKKYTIIAEIIGSLFIIVLCSLLRLALYQSGGYIINAIFLISLYILTLMVCTFVIVYILGKVNKHWDPDEIYLTIAARGNISLRRMKQLQFFLLGMSCSGLLYSSICWLRMG